jgi:predicted metal-dependent phosphoesterase TrpH
MKIDLHIHLEERGAGYARRVIIMAKEAELDGICLVEHNAFPAEEFIKTLAKQTDFPVFGAAEYSSNKGHIMLIHPEAGFTLPEPRLPMQEIIDLCIQNSAIAIPVHPYSTIHRNSPGNGIYNMKNIAAIETINGAIPKECNTRAQEAANRLGLKGIGGSDAHSEFLTGRAFTIFEDKIKTQEDLVNALINGRYAPSYRKRR